MQIAQDQVDDFIFNLKGRLAYETKKATKLGFSSIQEYVTYKLIKEAEEKEQSLKSIPKIKTLKVKPIKKKAVKPSTCGCCP